MKKGVLGLGKSYYDKLNTPQWRKKCKKILARDKYRCTACGSSENLSVHHTFYFDNYPDPWKYPDKSLITLCEKCHRDYHHHHEIKIRHFNPTRKKKHNAKQKTKNLFLKNGVEVNRTLRKVRHGKGFIYDLKTEYSKKAI